MTHTTCNLTALDKYLAVMRLYTKTRAFTGVDKLIPHALDAFTADLTIQDLAIARPFAEMVVQLCFPNRLEVKQLYKDRLFVNHTKEFTSTDLTHYMETLTLPISSFGININSWRHIHVNFSRKHCGHTHYLLEGSKDDMAGVLQYGHGRSIHDNIYNLGHDSMTGVAEDILPLCLDASTIWQVLN
jgi:hypothetical protein